MDCSNDHEHWMQNLYYCGVEKVNIAYFLKSNKKKVEKILIINFTYYPFLLLS